MLTNTQISSYLVPENIWNDGIPGNNQITPILIPARDAMEIERRRNNNINLRNEDHRYTVACERIQALAVETHQHFRDLPEPVIWHSRHSALSVQPTALSYLAAVEVLYRGLFRSLGKLPYQRFLAVFFPPNDAKSHLSLYQFLLEYPKIDNFMGHAASLSRRMGSGFEVSASDCKAAILARRNLLETAVSLNCGLIDVISIV